MPKTAPYKRMSRVLYWIEYLLKAWVDFTFRRRSLGMGLIHAGIVLIAAVLSGVAIGVSFPLGNGRFRFSFSTDAGFAKEVMLALLGLGVFLVLFGIYRLTKETAAAARLRAIVIELRGLRDWRGAPLIEALPDTIRAQKESISIDVRQGVIDGTVVSPEAALKQLEAVRPRVNTIENGLDRRDVTYFVGGLAPVPFLFLLGILVDDEVILPRKSGRG